MGEPPLLVAAVYPTVTAPSPALIEEICGADGSAGVTVTVRETELAAEKVASPGCVALSEQVPIVRNVMRPLLDWAHTELPEVIETLTARPLELDASGINPGWPISYCKGWANEMA